MRQELKGLVLKAGLALNRLGYLVPDAQLPKIKEVAEDIDKCLSELNKEVEELEKQLQGDKKPNNEEIKEKFCDAYCQFPNITRGQEDLEAMCENCPSNKL